MKLVLYVEGDTEKYLPEFLKRWLDPRLSERIAIAPVNLGGVGNYLKEFDERVRRDLGKGELCGAVGLIDLYGSGLHSPPATIEETYARAKQELEARVGDPRFRQHFAVHETEAWLLSDLQVLPREIRAGLPKTANPETVNLINPPSHRLKDLYFRKLQKKYKKPVEGSSLFRKLDPEVASSRCPHLKLLLDDLLALAGEAVQTG